MFFARSFSTRSSIAFFVAELIGLLLLIIVMIVLENKVYDLQVQKNLQTAKQVITIESQQADKELRADQIKIQQALNVALLPDQVNQFVNELQQYGTQRHVTVTVADISAQAEKTDAPLQAAKVHVLADGAPDQLLYFLHDISFSSYLASLDSWTLRISTSAGTFRLPTPLSAESPAVSPSAPVCSPWALDAVLTLFIRQPHFSL